MSNIDLYIFYVGNIFVRLGWSFNVVIAIYEKSI